MQDDEPCDADWRGGGRIDDRHQKPVAAARQRLDELRRIRCVAKYLANLADTEVQPLVEVHVRVAAPDVIADLRACDHLPAVEGEQFEDLERLRRQLEDPSALP